MGRVIRSLAGLALDVVPIVVVAYLVFHLIRTHVLEQYIVPSRSMEPTLHGHPQRGDRVLVDKTAFWGGRMPRPFDLVVVRSDDDAEHTHFVKRVVAMDGQWVLIRDGDLFVGERETQTGEGALQLVAKDPVAARDMQVTHFAFPEIGDERIETYCEPSDAWTRRGRQIVLRPAAADVDAALEIAAKASRKRPGRTAPRGHLSTAKSMDATFLDCEGKQFGRTVRTRDNAIHVIAVASPSCRAMQLVQQHRGVCYSALLERDGTARFCVAGRPEGDPVRTPPWDPSGRLDATFGYLDGRFYLLLGDECHLLVERDLDGERPIGASRMHVGAVGGPISISRLRFSHDVYYDGGSPFGGASARATRVGDGQLFLLGDNTFDSHDSRSLDSFMIDDLVGRPLAVIAPLARARWLR